MNTSIIVQMIDDAYDGPGTSTRAEQILLEVLAEVWEHGYDRAESDRSETGFWDRGKRGNPYSSTTEEPIDD